MGYVKDDFSIVIPFSEFSHSAGTWTPTVASNVWFARRTAADAAATTLIPLGNLLQRSGIGSQTPQKGTKIESVEIHFRIGTAALDAMEAHLYKATLAADGSLLTVAEVTTTYDTGHDSAAERIDVDEHKMTLTVTTPAYIDDGEFYFMEVVYDAAATSVIDEFLSKVNCVLRA